MICMCVFYMIYIFFLQNQVDCTLKQGVMRLSERFCWAMRKALAGKTAIQQKHGDAAHAKPAEWNFHLCW